MPKYEVRPRGRRRPRAASSSFPAMLGRSLLLVPCVSLFPSWWSSEDNKAIADGGVAATGATAFRNRRRSLRRNDLPALSSSSSSSLASSPFKASTRRYLSDRQLYSMDTLQFTFDDGNDDTPPTDLEFKAAMCQVAYFYADFLQEGRPEESYTDLTLHVLDWSFVVKDDNVNQDNNNNNNNHHQRVASISYIVNATDETGTYLDPVVMNERLGSREFFLQRMVQRAWPLGDNVFAGVKSASIEPPEVWEEARVVAALATPDTVQFSTSQCPERGTFKAEFLFGYFANSAREPTQEEVDHLQELMTTFMTTIMEGEIQRGDLEIEFQATDRLFTPDVEFPLNMTFQVRGYFEDQQEIPMDVLRHHLASRLVDGGSLMEDFIQSVAWKVPPEQSSSFFDVNRARLQSKIHKFSDMEIKSNPLFLDALSAIPSPIEPPHYTGSMTRLPGNPPADGSTSTPAASPADTEIEEPPDRGFSLNIGGFGIPVAAPQPERGEGPVDDPSSPLATSRPGTTSDPESVPVVYFPGGVLRPVHDNEPGVEVGLCENGISAVDGNADTLLTKAEYIDLINFMTQTSFPNFPFDGLPEALRRNYNSLATTETPTGHFEMHTVRGNNDLVEDAVRCRQICQATTRAIGEAIEESPTRLPTEIATAAVEFLASCTGGEGCAEDEGMTSLTNAFQKFLQYDVAPIFSIRYNGANTRRFFATEEPAFLKPEQSNVTRITKLGCPGDPGSPDTKCYLAAGEIPVFVVGDNKEHAQDAALQVEAMVLDGVKAGLLDESLRLEAVTSPWQVYGDTNEVLTASPSEAPTASPSMAPSGMPTTTMPTIPPTRAPHTISPTQAPLVAPSTSPSSVPSQAPTQEKEQTLWDKITDFGSSELGVAAGASIAILIVLQCFKEILLDLVMKAFHGCYKLIRGIVPGDHSGSGSESGDPKHSKANGCEEEKQERDQRSDDESHDDDREADADASEVNSGASQHEDKGEEEEDEDRAEGREQNRSTGLNQNERDPNKGNGKDGTADIRRV